MAGSDDDYGDAFKKAKLEHDQQLEAPTEAKRLQAEADADIGALCDVVMPQLVIASLDTDLLAYVLGLFRLACYVETVAAGDRDQPSARNNQIDAALVALSIARPILLIPLIRYAESNRRGP